MDLKTKILTTKFGHFTPIQVNSRVTTAKREADAGAEVVIILTIDNRQYVQVIISIHFILETNSLLKFMKNICAYQGPGVLLLDFS